MDFCEMIQHGGHGHTAEQMRFSAAVCAICFPIHLLMFAGCLIHYITK